MALRPSWTGRETAKTLTSKEKMKMKEFNVNLFVDALPVHRPPPRHQILLGSFSREFAHLIFFISLICLYLQLKSISDCHVPYKSIIDAETFELNERMLELQQELQFIKLQLQDGLNRIQQHTNYITDENEKIDEKIQQALDLYDADKVGIIDYAYENSGGRIVSILDTIEYLVSTRIWILGISFNFKSASNPRKIIQSDVNPGDCFAFVGSQGKIRIMLSRLIEVVAVTLEHVRSNLVVDNSSAPKTFTVIGLEEKESSSGDELGEFMYDINGRPLQTFKVDETGKKYRYVELNILSNHGHERFTCVYRFRVHGNYDG